MSATRSRLTLRARLTIWWTLLWTLVLVEAYGCPPCDESESCMTKDDGLGECTLIPNCPAAKNVKYREISRKFTRCGFKDRAEIICCPEISIPNRDQFETPSERKASKACSDYNTNLPPARVALAPHILNGEEAAEGEFPHMAALGYESNNKITFDCGGSIISDRYLLTAAHCIIKVDEIEPSFARISLHNITNERSELWDYNIEQSLVHPNYNRSVKYNDIALLRLDKPIIFNREIRPLCLHTGNNDPGSEMIVTGWGTISLESEIKSDVLLKANLTIVDNVACNQMYITKPDRKLPSGIIDSQICAGDVVKNADTCQGDSGGPLQIHDQKNDIYKIVGITSFGKACGSKVPGIYTRVSSYLDWIESVVWP